MSTATSDTRLLPYVPRTLLEASARHDGAPTWFEQLDGALMHCDITGFTAMSESLASLGNEGAELMASVLNGFFETMLAVADAYGGVQMKFGGDAMLLYFEGEDGPEGAASCGLDMQRLMPRFRRVVVAGQPYVLRMRIGIHAGLFFTASVGGERGLHYVLLGRDVNETANIESLAKPGQVVATETAAERIAPHGVVVRQSDGVHLVRSIGVQDRAKSRAAASSRAAVIDRYVLPSLTQAIADDGTGLAAEQRRVTSMFVMLEGTTRLLEDAGEQAVFDALNSYVELLVACVWKHGGVVLGSDVAEHGDKFIILFGAPVLQEAHEAGSLRCANELSVALARSNLPLQHRIGVNTGSVFAGEIGSAARRDYTVIGDAVNLAARLMAAAKPGETLVSETTAARAGHAAQLRRRKPIRVKGKAEPVRLFALAGVADANTMTTVGDLPFVGRARERASLVRVRRVRPAEASWRFLSGEPGIGKTRLLQEVGRESADAQWRVLSAEGRSHTAGTPFGLWVDPLCRLLGVSSTGAGAPPLSLRDALREIAPSLAAFWTILAEALALPHEDDETVRALDPKTRRERLTALVVAILQHAASQQPLGLMFDDVQWSDAASLELLQDVLTRVHAPLHVIVASRDAAPPPQLQSSPEERVELRGLTQSEACELISPLVEGDRAREIVARTHGNPLFTIELAQAPLGTVMPDTVNDVVLARLDGLPRADREVLRLASVIGPSFDLRQLRAIENASDETRLGEACSRLTLAGFLHVEDAGFSFAHTLAREVAYETLLYADRRRLHRTLAAHIEAQEGGVAAPVQVLFHHYQAAREWGRVVRFAVLSGDRAAALFATDQALEYYRSGLASLDELGPSARVDRSIIFERMGDAFDRAGRYREAGDAYFTALSEWLARGSARRARYARIPVNSVARESAVARKISVSYERRSDYDQALSWIETALERLPAGSVSMSAEVMASKSVTLFRKGMYDEAVAWGERAVGIARRRRDRRITAYAHNMLANSYIEQGALKQAVRHLAASTRLYRELRDLQGQSAAGNNLGSCRQLLGNLDEALADYQDALQADTRLGNATHAAIVHNNIGEVLLTLGRTSEAREHLFEVLAAHAKGTGLAALTGLSEVNLSRCALIDGDAAEAEQHARRGIRLLRDVGAQGLLDEAELQLAEVRIVQGKYDAAIQRCNAAIARARASGARLLEARGLRLLGQAYAGRGQGGRAEQSFEASAALAKSIGAGIEEGKALIEIARLAATSVADRSGLSRLLDRAERILVRSGSPRELDEVQRLRAAAT